MVANVSDVFSQFFDDDRAGTFAQERANEPFVLPAHVLIEGRISINGDLVVNHGHDGTIHARHVKVGPDADIRGDIIADSVEVRGRIDGSIYAKKIVLKSSAIVEGECHFADLSIESGAWFEGKARRSEDPFRQAAAL